MPTPIDQSDKRKIFHATTVAHSGRAVMIFGASGAGKSGLALELMAFGARLVADDRTEVYRAQHQGNPQIMASVPEAIAGKIEARFVGVLHADAVDPQPVSLLVDLDIYETDRLPPFRNREILGESFALLHNHETRYFAAAILQYLKSGRHA